jgi:hypothetical protein
MELEDMKQCGRRSLAPMVQRGLMSCYEADGEDYQDDFGYCQCDMGVCTWHPWDEKRDADKLPKRSLDLCFEKNGTNYQDEWGFCECDFENCKFIFWNE